MSEPAYDDECNACRKTIYPENERITLCRPHYEQLVRDAERRGRADALDALERAHGMIVGT